MDFMKFFGSNRGKTSQEKTKTVNKTAGDKTPANVASGKTADSKNNEFGFEGPSLAEAICYYDRIGWTIEDMSVFLKVSANEIHSIVSEAKEAGIYDELADNMRVY